MRVLTVQNPWAHAIFHGKDIENRTRSLGSYRGPVAIHGGLNKADATDTPQWDLLMDIWRREGDAYQLHFGAIIGVVDLVDIHEDDSAACYSCSDWADGSGFHMVLENPRPLREPIPFKGALGLRRLDDKTVARVLAAIA